jgi:hypothetical protein
MGQKQTSCNLNILFYCDVIRLAPNPVQRILKTLCVSARSNYRTPTRISIKFNSEDYY